jgi:hypothetical protein
MSLIVFVSLLLAAWILYMLFSDSGSVETVTENPQETVENTESAKLKIEEVRLQEEQERKSVSSDVETFSKTFVERYGSYSNEARFANLRDVLPLMSESFAAKTQRIIDEGKSPEEYYGVSTKVVSVLVVERDESLGRAQVVATTQRSESVGSPQNTTIKYQDIEINFVMESGAWKIDSANWR